jgi:hypothetical protein
MLLLSMPMTAAPQRSSIRIVPFHATITLSKECSANAWIGYVKSARNRRAYELRLEPEIDIANDIAGWNVLLYESEVAKHNLLEPRGTWHGLQPFMIVAADLTEGLEKSVFGAQRTLRVSDRQLIVRIQLEDAKVSTQERSGSSTFSELRLSLAVENF